MSSSFHDSAQEPFNDIGSSDTIFRTSDGINFYIHRVVLFLASPFFRDMFSLPQSTSNDGVKPVIEVTESSNTLDSLLRFCYPVDDPIIQDLALLGDVLEAALKYQLSASIKILKKMFRTFIHNNSLRVFGISCRLQLEEEASLAAHRWRELSPSWEGRILTKGKFLDWENTTAGASYVDEMANISAGAYHRLTQFVRTGMSQPFCIPQKEEPASETSHLTDDKATVSHEFNFSDFDLIVISSDGVEFQVHELIIRLASSDILQNVTVNEDGRRQVSLPEDSRTLTKIFEIYYPTTDFNLSDLSLAFLLLLAALKYKMGKAVTTAKVILKARMCEDPLRIYYTFVRNDFMEDAAEVVRNALLQQSMDGLYIPEMEDIPAKWHYQLLEHRHRCLSALVEVCAKYESDPTTTTADTEWWNMTAPNYNTVPAPASRSLASPVVQRELRVLQQEARKHFKAYQLKAYTYSYERSDSDSIAKFSLEGIYRKSQKLEEEVNSALSKIELQTTCGSVYKIPPATFPKEKGQGVL